MVSSYASPELRALAQSAGALDLLEKPFRFAHLTRLLDSCLTASSAPAIA
jgi:CheY-like chemotaxis protein